MAASGPAVSDSAADEMDEDSGKNHLQIMDMMHKNSIFAQTFSRNDKNAGSTIARCLEHLNALPSKAYLKSSLEFGIRNALCFGKEKPYTKRINRSPSTDSIAASNSCSDQGSVDSCHYSSNGSDSNGGSSPCSPEGLESSSRAGTPQPMPPIPAALQESSCDEDSREALECHHRGQHHSSITKDNETRTQISDFCSDNATGFCIQQPQQNVLGRSCPDSDQLLSSDEKHCYLQNNVCSVPSSTCEPFQSIKSQTSVSSSGESSSLFSDKVTQGDHSESRFAIFKSKLEPNEIHSGKVSASSRSANQPNCSSSELQQCNWINCDVCVDGNTELVEHIRTKHVQLQIGKESFVCLWAGCKVYNRASCSLSWLERHILSHGGNKPFKCIVDGCSLRFPSQATLQRHVNSHFDSNQGSNTGGKTGKSKEDLTKGLKRRRNLKYIKKSASSKTEDFFDAHIMEHIRYKLVEMNSLINFSSDGDPGYVTFYSRVKAKRTDESGKVKVLLQWVPENILPDSWVSDASTERCRRIPYSSLSKESLALLNPFSSSQESDSPPPTKRRRK